MKCFFLKVEHNLFHCILMSIGMFIEGSRGTVTKNIFQYVANMIVLSLVFYQQGRVILLTDI